MRGDRNESTKAGIEIAVMEVEQLILLGNRVMLS